MKKAFGFGVIIVVGIYTWLVQTHIKDVNAQSIPEISITFNPTNNPVVPGGGANEKIVVGQAFTVIPQVNAGSAFINRGIVNIQYNPNLVPDSDISFTPNPSLTYTVAPQKKDIVVSSLFGNTTARVIYFEFSKNGGATGTFDLGTITFKSRATGTVNLNYVNSDFFSTVSSTQKVNVFNNLSGSYTITQSSNPTPTPIIATKSLACGTIGDVNNDGQITSNDTNMVLQIMTGSLTPTADQKKRADVSGDGIINTEDSTALARYVQGLETTFKACGTLPLCPITLDPTNSIEFSCSTDKSSIIRKTISSGRIQEQTVITTCQTGFECSVTNSCAQCKPKVALTCDPNGDGTISSSDFEIWKDEYISTSTTDLRSDCFLRDGKVDLIDFQVWKDIAVLKTKQPF